MAQLSAPRDLQNSKNISTNCFVPLFCWSVAKAAALFKTVSKAGKRNKNLHKLTQADGVQFK